MFGQETLRLTAMFDEARGGVVHLVMQDRKTRVETNGLFGIHEVADCAFEVPEITLSCDQQINNFCSHIRVNNK